MNEPITPEQALCMGGRFASFLKRADPTLLKDDVQLMLEDPKRMTEVSQGVADLVRQALYPIAGKISQPAWYPPGWRIMTHWGEQLAELRGIFPTLNSVGLSEMASSYLDQADLWVRRFTRDGYDQSYPLYDGLVVYALPGKTAANLDLGDLWADVAKGPEGEGLWGQLCEKVLFPHFALPERRPRFPAFYSNSGKGQMDSDRFQPLDSVAE